jgi:hypothetical protein
LAAQLKRLINEPETRATLSQRASGHLSKFQSDAVTAAYLGLMDKVIA